MDQKIVALAIDLIDCEDQVRTTFDADGLAKLAQTIKHCGVQEPIHVRGNGERYTLIRGERRLRATKLAGLPTIPAIVIEEPLTDAQITRQQLIENLQREGLDPIDQANGVRRLLDLSGQTASEVANELGLSASAVARSLPLLTLPTEMQEKVKSGQIPASVGYDLSRIQDPIEQAEYARKIVAGEMTRDVLSSTLKARRRRIGNTSIESKPCSRVTACLSNQCTLTLSGAKLMTVDDFINCLTEALDRGRRARAQGLGLRTFLRTLKDRCQSTQGEAV